MQIQEKLPAQTNEIAGKYIRMENAVPAERWNQVKDRMRIIFYDHWENILQRLKEVYGTRFNRELYDDAQRYVDDHLPERKQIKGIEAYSEREASRSQNHVDDPKRQRRDDNVL